MADVILENARTRTLKETDAAIIDAEDQGELHLLMTLQTRRRAILRAGWWPPRPPRRLPDLWAIVRYWAERDTFGDIREVPHCFGCGKIVAGISAGPAPEIRWNFASGLLERAHLITRSKDGLDGPQNLVPLCPLCHKMMPFFDVGDEHAAIKWVRGGGRFTIPGQLEREIAEIEAIYAAAAEASREAEATGAGGQYSLFPQ